MDFRYKSLEYHLEGLRKSYADTVNSIICEATRISENGIFEVRYNDIPGDFFMSEDRYLIAEMLAERSEIIEAEAHGYGFIIKLDPQHCERMNANADSIPESHLNSPHAINLIASYENLLPVQARNRITHYWGEYGGYVKKHGITDGHLRLVCAEALQAVNMSSEAYHDRKFVYRDEVEAYMRGCMLARILVPEDDVVFVPPAPTGPYGEWQYEAGRVIEMDAVNKTCVVSFGGGEVTIPFRYVLARFRDNGFDGNAFGFEHAEPIFGLTESWAERFMWEAKQEYEKQRLDEEVAPVEDVNQGMTMQ